MANYPYKCEHCRKAPKVGVWARNWKWKTERGFKNHRCYKDELKLQEKRQKENEAELVKRIEEAGHVVGERVIYCSFFVTKPSHEWRGTRKVKVRYEEERTYYAREGTIDKITRYGYLINGTEIRDSDIFDTLEAADKEAEKRGAKYNEGVEFARMCR